MFGSSEDPEYEGVWKIEDVSPLGDDEVIVSFTTGFYPTKQKAEDPECRRISDYGPYGEEVQTVRLSKNEIPSADEFNQERNHLYTVLTETLSFESNTQK